MATISFRRVNDEGYDLGLHASSEEGVVEAGVSVKCTPRGQSVGIFLEAPRLKRLCVALALDENGRPLLASVADPEGAPAGDLSAALAQLGAELAEERQRAAQLAHRLAQAELASVEEALPGARERAAALAAELALERTRAEQLQAEKETLAATLEAYDSERNSLYGQLSELQAQLDALAPPPEQGPAPPLGADDPEGS